MTRPVFRVRRELPADACEHCGQVVARVWLVPGDVLDSCAVCFERAAGRPPVHEHGHTTTSTAAAARPAGRAASFYLRADGRRPA